MRKGCSSSRWRRSAWALRTGQATGQVVVSLIVRALAFTYVRREPAVSSSARLHETGARCFLKCPSSFLNVTAAVLEPDALKGLSGRCVENKPLGLRSGRGPPGRRSSGLGGALRRRRAGWMVFKLRQGCGWRGRAWCGGSRE